MSESYPFSSGNPKIEVTSGVVHAISSSYPNLPVGRKPHVFVLGVRDCMTYADFCKFCASFVHCILEMQVVRNNRMEDGYSVIIRMNAQDSADNFYRRFNDQPFISFQEEVCRILYIVDVEQPHTPPVAISEQPSCPVCRESLGPDMSGILTTICNHSMHISCVLKWTNCSCPVCWYRLQEQAKSICEVCKISEDLSMCLCCGFVGCARCKGGHAIGHLKETQHSFSLDLESQDIWHYVGEDYLFQLMQSKHDKKRVQLISRSEHSHDDCGRCNFASSQLDGALLSSRAKIAKECKKKIEDKKLGYECELQKFQEETERQILEAVAATVEVQEEQAKLDNSVKKRRDLEKNNKQLLQKQKLWEAELSEAVESERNALRAEDNKIRRLKKKVQDLMDRLDSGS
ncbi:hypothetical protein ACJRO7_005070 [Eucalyptus globulus]|uniref:BRCA1-associated protein n=1 Tax=Eucalyptus globulus TaxID=34317 RepID=A0ABD3J222_EUCGL